MVSVICCYNKEKIFEELLAASLQLQENVEYEVVAIRNLNGEFPSAAAALNHGALLAKGDVLVFCHQDIEFLEKDALKKIRDECYACKPGDIIGVAGNQSRNKKIISNIQQERKGKVHFKRKVKGRIVVETVDECLFAMRKETWENAKFDEKTFTGWHLYAVDLCLRANKEGHSVFVIDSKVFHRSPGRLDDTYWMDFRKLIKKYKKDFDYITTTCVCSHTNLIFEIKYLIWKCLRHFLRVDGKD